MLSIREKLSQLVEDLSALEQILGLEEDAERVRTLSNTGEAQAELALSIIEKQNEKLWTVLR